MKFEFFAVYDSVSASYAAPFLQSSDVVAERTFRQLCQDPQSSVYRSPGDYSLWHVGSYDDTTGTIESIKPVQRFYGGNYAARKDFQS